jgi:hypothetical protein
MTEEELRKAIAEGFFGPDLTYEELRERVLPGYAYSISSGNNVVHEGVRNVNLQTGKGGVLLIIDACEKQGVPPGLLAKDIIVHTDMGSFPLSEVKIKKKDE